MNVQAVNVLMSRYVSEFYKRYGQKPKFNRYKEKWGFEYMFEDLGSEAAGVIEYYFTLNRRHSPQDLLRNYEEISEWRVEDEKDAALRKQLRQETKKKVEGDKCDPPSM